MVAHFDVHFLRRWQGDRLDVVDQAEPSLLYTSTVWHRWETPKYPRPCPGPGWG